MGSSLKFDRPDPRLRRDIGYLGASFVILNGMVGAGILASPEIIASATGFFGPWLFLILGLAISSVAYCYGELASYFRASGGPILYTAEAFGPFVSFQTGWLDYASKLTASAGNVNVLILYAASLWPAIGQGPARTLVLVAIYAGLIVVNLVGVKRAVRALDALTLLKLLPLLGIVVFGLFAARDRLGSPFVVPELSALQGAAIVAIYALIGFDSVVIAAGETARPRRTLPRSLMTTVGATAIFYFVVQLSYTAVVGSHEVEGAALVELGRVLGGTLGGGLISLIGVFSVSGYLMATSISTPRLSFALAREGELPSWFAHVSERFHTPDRSIIVFGTVACALAIIGNFVWLAAATVLARFILYSLCIATLPRIRKLAGTRTESSSVHGFVHKAVPAFAVTLCLVVIAQSSFEAWRLLLGLVATGSILRLIARRSSQVPPEP